MKQPKADELEVVELTQDLPEYDLSKGAQGTVVEVFTEPYEAYMIEFRTTEDEWLLADGVLPDQIKNLRAMTETFLKPKLKAS